MTTATQDVKPTTFEYMGERLDIDPETGWQLLARYRQAAETLHAAKAAAKAVEQEIMQLMQGYEAGAINGQEVFTWRFVDSTSFDVKAFKDAGDDYRALYDFFCKTKTTRRFHVDGTVGVD